MKITDTCKRVMKFTDVTIQDSELMDEEGSIVAQIIQNLPKDAEYFDVRVTAVMSPESDIE